MLNQLSYYAQQCIINRLEGELMKQIIFKNVNFSYQVDEPVIKDLPFEIESGSYTTLIGHNGSGKSTVAKLMMGLLEADRGEILIKDLPMDEKNLSEIRKSVGMVFQNPDNQFIGATVEDDIAFGLENNQVAQTEMEAIIHKYASDVGMFEYLKREPEKLSGGQKQRVAIAGVLAMTPEIIIFDEATSMLDPRGKREIKEMIKHIHKHHHITVISITHDIEEVVDSDYVYVLNHGQVELHGKPEDVLLLEHELVALSLDVPFAKKIQSLLYDAGVELTPTIKIEGVIDQLCQLK